MYDIVKKFLEKDDVLSLAVDGEPVFEAKSTAIALGFEIPWKAIAVNVEEDEYITLTKEDKKMVFLKESGLYSLAMASDTQEAKEFQKWLFSQMWFKEEAKDCMEQLLHGGDDNE